MPLFAQVLTPVATRKGRSVGACFVSLLGPRWVLGVCLAGTTGCAPSASKPLIFAAASLRDVVQDAAKRFEVQGGPPLAFNFAGSNVLAGQIRATQGAEVFLSADKAWMDAVVQAGRVVEGSVGPVARNSLVVIANRSNPLTLPSLSALSSSAFALLSLANPAAVPAGKYAKAALQKAGVWKAIETRVVPAPNVRQATQLVEREPRALGVVYKTEALRNSKVRIVVEITSDTTSPIEVWGAEIVHAQGRHAGRDFLRFLWSPGGQELFAARGFAPSPAHGSTKPTTRTVAMP